MKIFTITTADNSGRSRINGVPTALGRFRGSPYPLVAESVLHPPEMWMACRTAA